MRIISGKHKGRRLELSKEAAAHVRPTSDFARQAIFNILTHGKHGLNGHTFEDKVVLDVCCGTGAFGLEALSRGAAKVTFIDQSREALACAKHNVTRAGELEACDFVQANLSQLPKARREYDVIFIDPPYQQKLLPVALESLRAGGWIAPDAVLVIEHDESETVILPPAFTCVDSRRYGRAMVELIKLSA
ncbi:MAG: 16S rRNA (guanine(966)-N(2))-methyltransferase RsmD [Rickettsiales bacterium]|jgi:16S rRNA (guanine966-N2)-methyltransferase|nr:16S rRNA (guanine(966)-N(2))-methyltransferase RsmD [Rickettsiales bacterium]